MTWLFRKNHWFRFNLTYRIMVEYIGFNHDGHNYFTVYWYGTPKFRKRFGKYKP